MLKIIGPTIYISSAATVLLISTLMGQVGMFKLQFPAVYLFSVAINALTTRYWPSENYKESRSNFHEALIITIFFLGRHTSYLNLGPILFQVGLAHCFQTHTLRLRVPHQFG